MHLSHFHPLFSCSIFHTHAHYTHTFTFFIKTTLQLSFVGIIDVLYFHRFFSISLSNSFLNNVQRSRHIFDRCFCSKIVSNSFHLKFWGTPSTWDSNSRSSCSVHSLLVGGHCHVPSCYGYDWWYLESSLQLHKSPCEDDHASAFKKKEKEQSLMKCNKQKAHAQPKCFHVLHELSQNGKVHLTGEGESW